MKFTNVRYRSNWKWNWEHVLKDLDGTLTDLPVQNTRSSNGQQLNAVSRNKMTINNPSCKTSENFNNGLLCYSSSSWIRFAFLYDSIGLGSVFFEDIRGNSANTPRRMVRLTYQGGMMVALESNKEYLMYEHVNASVTNISYDGLFSHVKQNEFIILKHKLEVKPDRVKINSKSNPISNVSLSIDNNFGDWYWDNYTQEVSFIIMNKGAAPRNIIISVNIFKCFFDDCILPIIEEKELVMADRNNSKKFYSSDINWILDSNNVTDYTVNSSMFLIVDAELPRFKSLRIEGFFELSNNLSHVLEVESLSVVNGGELIIGTEESPITTDVEIKLGGFDSTNSRRKKRSISSVTMGTMRAQRADISIHGRKRNVSWTELSETVFAGQSLLKLIEPVDWESNEVIILSTTINKKQDEVLTILRVENGGKTVLLKEELRYDHLVGSKLFLLIEGHEMYERKQYI